MILRIIFWSLKKKKKKEDYILPAEWNCSSK